ncbi:MAG: HNH endonuclease [Blastocatellia bacterium]|nr:HNH endonuclease [Blastocatellia bacterium]
MAALIEREFGDRIPFAENRNQILNIAKQSGVAPKNISINGNRAEFDLTLEDTLKLKIAYNHIKDGLNRADAARLDVVNNNMFSQFVAGMFEGAKDSVAGTANIILDPVGTAKALWQVIGSPIETYNALYAELEKSWDKFQAADYVERSRMMGHLVGSVVAGILIGKGAGELGSILAKTKTGAALMEKANLLKSAAVLKIAEKFSDSAANLARKRLVSSLVGIGANAPLPATVVKDLGIVAGNKLKNGAVSFADFAKRMVDEFGEIVKPHLEKIYREKLIELGLTNEIDEIGIKNIKLDSMKPNPDAILDPPMATRNADLAGETHPVTEVPYNRSAYPIFDSKFDAELPKNLRGSNITDYDQFKEATRQLKREIENDPAAGSIFSKEQLADIMAEKPKIKGYTWHHHQDGIRLQLVDSKIHAKSGHDGGRKNTGGRPQ